jgi:hypothetical protein
MLLTPAYLATSLESIWGSKPRGILSDLSTKNTEFLLKSRIRVLFH